MGECGVCVWGVGFSDTLRKPETHFTHQWKPGGKRKWGCPTKSQGHKDLQRVGGDFESFLNGSGILGGKRPHMESLRLLLTNSDTYQSQASQAKKLRVNNLFSWLANGDSLDCEEKMMVRKMRKLVAVWERNQSGSITTVWANDD